MLQYDWKWSLPDLNYYINNFLEKLKYFNQDSLCSERNLNWVPREGKSEALPLLLHCFEKNTTDGKTTWHTKTYI